MNTERVLSLLAMIVFCVAAFRFLKKHSRLSFVLFCFAFLSLILGCLKIDETNAEQFLCWLLRFLLLGTSIYLFADKDKFSFGMIVFLFSVGAFFCSLSSVQTFLKTGMLMKVVDSLDDYGKKLDGYQTNVIEMREDLSIRQNDLTTNQFKVQAVITDITNKQAIIAAQQLSLSNQFVLLSAMTNTLFSLEATNAEQQKQLSDMTYWVHNLYDNIANETFTFRDTNKITLIFNTNNTVYYIFRLNHAPVRNSAEVTLKEHGIEQKEYSVFVYNITVGSITGYNTNDVEFSVRYVIDTRSTNFYKMMPELNKDVMIVPFPNGNWGVNPPPN